MDQIHDLEQCRRQHNPQPSEWNWCVDKLRGRREKCLL